MKAKYIGAAALLAAALAACGGKASFNVAGTITGLSNDGLVLQNGNDSLNVAAGATTFSFPNGIGYGTEYNVTVKNDPAHMHCSAINGTGSAGHTATINVVVTCNQLTYTVGGSVVNLQGDGLVIINGSTAGSLPISKGATEFTYQPAIPVGQAYGLAILTQPTGQTCSIANGSGVMGDAARANAVITCQ